MPQIQMFETFENLDYKFVSNFCERLSCSAEALVISDFEFGGYSSWGSLST